MNIFYPYKHSPHDELKYSLRSIDKYLQGTDISIYIACKKEEVPAWLNTSTVTVLEFLNLPTHRNANSAQKVFHFCKYIKQKDFILFNDDHILLKPTTEDDIKHQYCLENLSLCKTRGKRPFQKKLWATYDLLKQKGFTGYSAACHIPFHFEVDKLLNIFTEFPTTLQGNALPKTLYLNYYLPKGQVPEKITQDIRIGIWRGKTKEQIETEYPWEKARYLNFDEAGYNGTPALQSKIKGMFKEKCRYEV